MALRTGTKLPTGVQQGPSAPGYRELPEPEPFGVRKVIRGFGKFFICVGILLFLFVAYELWGTGFAERRSQKALSAAFDRRSHTTTLPTLPGAAPSDNAAPDTTVAPVELGDGVAKIEIPKISLSKIVVQGVGVEDLKQGPGHYPDTPMPGEHGNAAIAGHRTTYGAPFYDISDLNPGDPIFVTTDKGRFRYDVFESKVVDPDAVWVLDPSPDDRLTLTTCNPRFSAAERLIVVAKLTSPPVATSTPPPTTPAAAGGSSTRSLAAGLSGAKTSKAPAILWGTFAAAIWAAGWVLGRRWRRLPAYAVAAIPFLLVLFVFYENVSRLLPANV